jgi:hypothetical protein
MAQERKVKKGVHEMTKKELLAIPMRKTWNEEIRCRSLVIIPGNIKDMHDSGYRLLDFVAVDEHGFPICRLSGCSDVVHIEGIGGLGYRWQRRYKGVLTLTKPKEWSIDCLPKSGLLRLFTRGDIICGDALSSFEIYSTPT